MQQMIVISGPTASGKTALSVEIAKHFKTVIISADSRQCYRELKIGTAKPSIEEMDGIPHYFIDSHSVKEPLSAGQFEQQALNLIKNELSHFSTLVLVGGSGMFIDALCFGLDPLPANEAIQMQLREELKQNGLPHLLNELKVKDPLCFETVDHANPKRILRALEVIRCTNQTFSSQRQNKPSPRPFKATQFVIQHPREQLYKRINQRVDQMMEQGLLAEVKTVEQLRELSALQTVGYRECFDYFDGKIPLGMCVEKIKQHTRNYAKRQTTWFKRNPENHWILFSDLETMRSEILQKIGN